MTIFYPLTGLLAAIDIHAARGDIWTEIETGSSEWREEMSLRTLTLHHGYIIHYEKEVQLS